MDLPVTVRGKSGGDRECTRVVDWLIASVDKNLASQLEASSDLLHPTAGDHKPFDAISYKSNDTTLGNVQLPLNAARDGADIDMDIGNMNSGDAAGPVVHTVEVIIKKEIQDNNKSGHNTKDTPFRSQGADNNT